jgi:hypothetical protein
LCDGIVHNFPDIIVPVATGTNGRVILLHGWSPVRQTTIAAAELLCSPLYSGNMAEEPKGT